MMETKDLILRKAEFDDWKAMYRNVWSHPETARYMMWRVTETEEAAQERIRRTIEFQKEHNTFFVYQKKSGQPIGFAGWEELAPHSFRETGIALGPEYVGRGYGKQIVNFLTEYCRDSLGGREFYYHARAKNTASNALALSCGFVYQRSEQRIDERNGEAYELRIYRKELK